MPSMENLHDNYKHILPDLKSEKVQNKVTLSSEYFYSLEIVILIKCTF